MDLELLRTFMEVCRTRHFRRAAENLYLSQSTVSARVRQLEDVLGTVLFTRERNNIRPTPAGQRLLPHAEQLLLEWSKTRQELAVGDARDTLLVVGASASLWDTLLQPWLVRVGRRAERVALRVETHDQEQLLHRLDDGRLDLVFAYEPPILPRHVGTRLARVALRLASSTPGLAPGQAVGEGYVLVDWGSSFFAEHARLYPDLQPPRLAFSQGRMALDWVLSAGGCVYLPEPMLAGPLQEGRLHLVEGALPIQREIFGSYRGDHRHAELLGKLVRRVKF
jgi:DNA-binding transcriptional LysR family regulator